MQRAITKSSVNYCNSVWDLVDAVREKEVKLSEVDADELPDVMRSMTIEQRHAYVLKQEQRRAELSARIQELNQQRQQFVADKMKASVAAGARTLDVAVIEVCRDQAQAKGFAFE